MLARLCNADLVVWPGADLCSSVMGVLARRYKGYYGGKVDIEAAFVKYGRDADAVLIILLSSVA